ncbi:hypothetical protein EDB86DRAFT_3242648 [Lactarius hatsudake]|nr:hypothetical protein EDB86DRAFT_3242648 [Lactarius hatsudake]
MARLGTGHGKPESLKCHHQSHDLVSSTLIVPGLVSAPQESAMSNVDQEWVWNCSTWRRCWLELLAQRYTRRPGSGHRSEQTDRTGVDKIERSTPLGKIIVDKCSQAIPHILTGVSMPGISVGGWRFGGLGPNIPGGLDEPFHGAEQREVRNVDAREDCTWTQFPFVRGCERERRGTKGERKYADMSRRAPVSLARNTKAYHHVDRSPAVLLHSKLSPDLREGLEKV